MEINRISLGGRFGQRPDIVSFSILDHFIAAGGQWVETAANYANGEGESQIGRWLARRGTRQSVAIIDKIGHGLKGDDACLSAPVLRAELEGCLQRLGVGHIDLLLLHRDEPSRPVEDVASTLATFIAKGSALACGVSNWSLDRCLELSRTAVLKSLPRPSWASLQYSLAVPLKDRLWPGARAADANAIKQINNSGLVFLAWSSQARGFFSDLACRASDLHAAFDHPHNIARRARASLVGQDHNVSASAVALAYVLGAAANVYASIGPETTGELSDSLKGAELDLDDTTRAMLDGLGGE